VTGDRYDEMSGQLLLLLLLLVLVVVHAGEREER